MERTTSTARLAASLFISFFTAQAAFVVLTPTLPEVARDFDVSVATAGQLRAVAAVAGLLTAFVLPFVRAGIGRTLRVGLLLLAGGALLSAAAPTFMLLAGAQVVSGAGAAMVLAAGLAAAGEWPAPERRADVIAWTIVGQPAAWVAALPVIGRLAESGWRWTWVVVPLAAAAALIALPKGRADASPQASRKSSGRVWEVPGVRAWAFGELMAYAGWGGTLMYSGALLAESYGLSANTVALLLAAGAVTYFPGAFSARRQIDGDLRTLLGVLAALLAVGTAVFGLVRPAPAVSAALFAVLVLVAGARGVAGGAFGLTAAPEHKLAIGSIRSGVGQLGYLVGAAAGGLALTVGGWAAVGMVLALFFSAAAAPHLAPRLRARAAVPVPLAVPAAMPCGA